MITKPSQFDTPARMAILLAIVLMIWLLIPDQPAAEPSTWGDDYHRTFHLSGHPTVPAEFAQADCLPCHRDVYDIREAAPVLYEGRKLFTTIGCVDCHLMDSVADYEKRKVGVDLRHVGDKLSPSFVAAWIADPQAFRPSTAMPRIFKTVDAQTRTEAAAITAYLFQNSSPATDMTAIPPGLVGNYENGRLLFQGHGLDDRAAADANLPPGLKAGLGCLACHTNLNDWNSDQPTSRGGDEREPNIVVDLMRRERLSQLDAEKHYAAMNYDQRQSYAMTMQSPVYVHFGPELSAVGEKLTLGPSEAQARQWLFGWLKNPRHYSGYTLMPNLRLSDQEAIDLATYLLAQQRDTVDQELRKQAVKAQDRDLIRILNDKPFVDTWRLNLQPVNAKDQIALGAKLIMHYGCMNCHEIGGAVSLSQTALDLSHWGSKPLDQFDFSHLPANKRTRQDWLMQHLMDSQVPALNESYDKPRMPIFRMSHEQAAAVTTFVIGNRSDSVDETLRSRAMNPAALAIAKGRAITDLHNCVGCHRTEVNRPAIQQYFHASWISTYAPPQLRGEGNRVQTDWLRGFLANVTKVRPLPMVRMPSFPFAADEIPGLVDYFQAASVRESEDLKRWIGRDNRGKLIQWAMAWGQASPIDLNPVYSTERQIEQTDRDIVFKATFAANLYGSPDPSAAKINDVDFNRGEKLLQTLQCLDCHILAADEKLVDQSHAKAPNLELTWRRLQRGWVRAWVQEPDVVIHGTNMPPYFTGLATHNLGGEPLAIAQHLSPEQAAALSQFGNTVEEQTGSLLDFLYAAGAKGYTTQAKPEMNVFLHPGTPQR